MEVKAEEKLEDVLEVRQKMLNIKYSNVEGTMYVNESSYSLCLRLSSSPFVCGVCVYKCVWVVVASILAGPRLLNGGFGTLSMTASPRKKLHIKSRIKKKAKIKNQSIN